MTKTLASWEYTKKYYEEYCENYPEYSHLKDLVFKMSNSEYSKDLFPVTSVATLILTFYPGYEEGNEKDYVSIAYQGDNKYRVRYDAGKRKERESEVSYCYGEDLWKRVESYVLRLENPDLKI